MIAVLRGFLQKAGFALPEKNAVEAYDAWSVSYDHQPGNLMLDLDEELFDYLISGVSMKDKIIADIGCGTGRHWPVLYNKQPKEVIGFDVSAGMLDQLLMKFPDALVYQTSDNRLPELEDQSVDFLISTLTVAHIKNISEAIEAWARILKPGGQLIITDFHPEVLSKGGKRSFSHEGKTIAVKNYAHELPVIESLCIRQQMILIQKTERWIDASVRHYYEARHALDVYELYEGLPVIYGLLLKKQGGPR